MQLTIRDVSPEVHEILTARAKARRQSLNAFLLDLLEREASTPSVAELLARLEPYPPVSFDTDDIVAAIRKVRDA